MSSTSDPSTSMPTSIEPDSTNLHAWILNILVYGLYTDIFGMALYITLIRGTDRPRVGSAVLLTVIRMLVTVRTGLNWSLIDEVYLSHPIIESNVGHVGETYTSETVGRIISFLGVILADSIMIWRCWVLYGKRWVIVLLPALLFTCSIVTFTFWEAMFYATSVVLNVFSLVAIITRIVSVAGIVKSFRTYHGILEILIESSFLYTGTYIILIALELYSSSVTSGNDSRFRYVRALADVCTGVAPTLVIARRVAAGYARPNDSWTHTSLPHIRTDMQSFTESLHFARPVSGTVTELERSRGNIALEPIPQVNCHLDDLDNT